MSRCLRGEEKEWEVILGPEINTQRSENLVVVVVGPLAELKEVYCQWSEKEWEDAVGRNHINRGLAKYV